MSELAKIGVFMADGCEEIEGLTVVDIARRAGIEVLMISVSGNHIVCGSHGINFETDINKSQVDYEELDGIVLPGGLKGTENLSVDETVLRVIRDFARENKMVAAICAAPSVLGMNHILEGRNATCHPGFEDKLLGANWLEEEVVCDGNIITSRGMGTAIPFALAIVDHFADISLVERVKKGLVYR